MREDIANRGKTLVKRLGPTVVCSEVRNEWGSPVDPSTNQSVVVWEACQDRVEAASERPVRLTREILLQELPNALVEYVLGNAGEGLQRHKAFVIIGSIFSFLFGSVIFGVQRFQRLSVQEIANRWREGWVRGKPVQRCGGTFPEASLPGVD